MGTPLSCREVEPLLDTFADGELDASDTVWVESHLAACPECVERLRFAFATKASIQRVFESDADEELPNGFLARVGTALADEQARTNGKNAKAVLVKGPRAWWQRWDSLTPVLAVAAGFLLWINLQPSPKLADVVKRDSRPSERVEVASLPTSPSPGASSTEDDLEEPDALEAELAQADEAELEQAPRKRSATAHAVESRRLLDPALDRLIDYHTSPPQPQVTEARLLPAFEPTVGVRLRLPSLARAKWQGANLVPVVNHQAASLRYQMPGRRQVTVWVFDPRKVSLREPLSKHVVEGNPIYVGEWRGYSVAAKENRGIGYAMAADLDAKSLTQLITSIH